MSWTFGQVSKIQCVEKNIDDGQFTLNKIYDVVDGTLITDNGYKYENMHFLRDLNDRFIDATLYEVFGLPIGFLYRFTFFPITQ